MNNLLDHIATGLSLSETFETFRRRWQIAYERFGQDPAGELAYRDAWLYFQEEIHPLVRRQLATESEGREAAMKIEAIFKPEASPQRINRQMLAQIRRQRSKTTRAGGFQKPAGSDLPDFDRPLFIVSAPRAGSTLLFETLAHFAELWTIGMESHDIEADIPEFHPATGNYASNRLTAAEATPAISQAVRGWFSRRLQDRDGCLYQALPAEKWPAAVRFLEKTPKNALRIPFLKAIFPDARFIFLYREPRQNISSLLEGWRSQRFVAYREMPGWPYKHLAWNFLLAPGWEDMIDRPLVEIAAYQWQTANEQIWADLQHLPPTERLFVTYAELTERPTETLHRISRFAGLDRDERVEQVVFGGLPLSRMVISPPAPDKWRNHAAEIETVLPMIEPFIKQVERLATKDNGVFNEN